MLYPFYLSKVVEKKILFFLLTLFYEKRPAAESGKHKPLTFNN